MKRQVDSEEDKSIATEKSNDWARAHGYDSYRQYTRLKRLASGFKSESEYQQFLARKGGLRSATQYQRKLKLIRSQNPAYKELARLIRRGMAENGLTIRSVAQRAGISRSVIADYAAGYSFPKPSKLRRLLRALRVFYPTGMLARMLSGRESRQRPRHQRYDELSNLMRYYLSRFERDLKWLSEATGISMMYLKRYYLARNFPRPARLDRIISALRSLENSKHAGKRNSTPKLRHKSMETHE